MDGDEEAINNSGNEIELLNENGEASNSKDAPITVKERQEVHMKLTKES
jgi:hypothetical protein